MPCVSVIVPVYNEARFVGDAVRSVAAQTFTDWELIVVDDGSSDETPGVLRELAQLIPRMELLRQENRGRSAARNAGIRRASGEYVAFLDADDTWLPHKLEIQVALLEASPQAGLAYAKAMTIEKDGSSVGRGWILGEAPGPGQSCFARLTTVNVVPMSTAVVRRTCLGVVGPFTESLSHIEDWDLWLRLTARYDAVFTDRVLARYRFERREALRKLQRHDVQETLPRMLEAAFDSLSPRSPYRRLRSGALARAHLFYGACLEYALERYHESSVHLERAIHLDGDLADDLYRITTPVAQFAALYLSDGSEFIDRFSDNLPGTLAGRAEEFRSVALSRYYVELAYHARRAGEWRHAVRHGARALVASPLTVVAAARRRLQY
jgi:glycosyltransferase involved in cell wall biosynthesis